MKRKTVKKIIVKTGDLNVPGIQINLSAQVAKAMRIVRRHFRILTDERLGMPYEAARHEGWWEFASIAVRNVVRLEHNLIFGGEISIGSWYLSERPWAILGSFNSKDVSEYKFPSLPELIEHYDKEIKDHWKLEYEIPFVDDPIVLTTLAERCCETIENIFGVCILFTRDLIFHAGPDLDMFFDLFTNDNRDNPDTVDLDEWEINRCRLFGRFGVVNSKSHCTPCNKSDYHKGWYTVPVEPKRKFKKCDPSLDFISRNAPLIEESGLSINDKK